MCSEWSHGVCLESKARLRSRNLLYNSVIDHWWHQRGSPLLVFWFAMVGPCWLSGQEAKIRNHNTSFLSTWLIVLMAFQGQQGHATQRGPAHSILRTLSPAGPWGKVLFWEQLGKKSPVPPLLTAGGMHCFWGSLGPPSLFPPARSSLVSFSRARFLLERILLIPSDQEQWSWAVFLAAQTAHIGGRSPLCLSFLPQGDSYYTTKEEILRKTSIRGLSSIWEKECFAVRRVLFLTCSIFKIKISLL